jgi:hypoxanthine phosphoribosyltransferase
MKNDRTQLDQPHVRCDIARVLVSRRRIARRVGELADAIAARYAGRELTILAVLTGSLIFVSDLIRRLPLRMRLDLVSVCSYPGTATTSQGPHIETELGDELRGKDVLIVDDILDSGKTVEALVTAVESAGAASVGTCVLLRKRRDDLPDRIGVDLFGFDVEPEFVVGYGLDYDRLYRNLPEICSLKAEALARPGGEQ